MDEKVKEYNDIYTANPDKWSGDFIRDWIAYTTIHKYNDSPASILDIGCGNGHTLEFLGGRWPGAKLYGIDLSDVAIDIAKSKLPDAEFMLGEFDEFDVHCDVVTIMGTAEHFEDLTTSLRKVRKFGDLFYLEVPDCIWMGLLNGAKSKLEGFRRTFKGGLQKEWHLKRSSWEDRIRWAGFDIIEFTISSNPGEFAWILR